MKKKVATKGKKTLPLKKSRMQAPMQAPMGPSGPPMMKKGGTMKKKGKC